MVSRGRGRYTGERIKSEVNWQCVDGRRRYVTRLRLVHEQWTEERSDRGDTNNGVMYGETGVEYAE